MTDISPQSDCETFIEYFLYNNKIYTIKKKESSGITNIENIEAQYINCPTINNTNLTTNTINANLLYLNNKLYGTDIYINSLNSYNSSNLINVNNTLNLISPNKTKNCPIYVNDDNELIINNNIKNTSGFIHLTNTKRDYSCSHLSASWKTFEAPQGPRFTFYYTSNGKNKEVWLTPASSTGERFGDLFGDNPNFAKNNTGDIEFLNITSKARNYYARSGITSEYILSNNKACAPKFQLFSLNTNLNVNDATTPTILSQANISTDYIEQTEKKNNIYFNTGYSEDKNANLYAGCLYLKDKLYINTISSYTSDNSVDIHDDCKFLRNVEIGKDYGTSSTTIYNHLRFKPPSNITPPTGKTQDNYYNDIYYNYDDVLTITNNTYTQKALMYGDNLKNNLCSASSKYAVSIGQTTTASGSDAFACNKGVRPNASDSQYWGIDDTNTTGALGAHCFSANDATIAKGNACASFGFNTAAVGNNVFACGSCNTFKDSNEDRLFIVGNGSKPSTTARATRSDAFWVNKSGDAYVSNNLTVNNKATVNTLKINNNIELPDNITINSGVSTHIINNVDADELAGIVNLLTESSDIYEYTTEYTDNTQNATMGEYSFLEGRLSIGGSMTYNNISISQYLEFYETYAGRDNIEFYFSGPGRINKNYFILKMKDTTTNDIIETYFKKSINSDGVPVPPGSEVITPVTASRTTFNFINPSSLPDTDLIINYNDNIYKIYVKNTNGEYVEAFYKNFNSLNKDYIKFYNTVSQEFETLGNFVYINEKYFYTKINNYYIMSNPNENKNIILNGDTIIKGNLQAQKIYSNGNYIDIDRLNRICELYYYEESGSKNFTSYIYKKLYYKNIGWQMGESDPQPSKTYTFNYYLNSNILIFNIPMSYFRENYILEVSGYETLYSRIKKAYEKQNSTYIYKTTTDSPSIRTKKAFKIIGKEYNELSNISKTSFNGPVKVMKQVNKDVNALYSVGINPIDTIINIYNDVLTNNEYIKEYQQNTSIITVSQVGRNNTYSKNAAISFDDDPELQLMENFANLDYFTIRVPIMLADY